MKIFLKFLILSCFLYIAACSSYKEKEVIDHSSKIRSAKKVAIIIRTEHKSLIKIPEIEKNMNNWLGAYKKNSEISILTEISDKIDIYNEQEERFYQRDFENGKAGIFLKYKSIGVIKNYLISNKSGLLKKFTDNGYEIIFIYEINYIISPEMQMMRLDSVITAIDKEFNINYLNFEFHDFETDEVDFPSIKNQMINKISKRLIEKIENIGLINKID